MASLTPHSASVQRWLVTGFIMVFIMVLLGGITRLTNSGLSMVHWEPLKGTLPPLTTRAWQKEFNHYKQYPEYQKKNRNITLAEFKTIYWWEYIHRMWGRLTGLVFLIPFGYFVLKRKLSPKLTKRSILFFILGASQALLGWFMVKSGLYGEPWVSPYRLTAHLFLAIGLLVFLEWTALQLREAAGKTPVISSPSRGITTLITTLIILTAIQIFYGGLMAGHKAALYYPEYPGMNGALLPEYGLQKITHPANWVDTPVLVQFFHRWLPALLILATGLLWYKGGYERNTSSAIAIKREAAKLSTILILQIILGVLTLINSKQGIPVSYAAMHQGIGILLFAFLIRMRFILRSAQESPNHT